MTAWNKGKRVGQKKAFKLEEIWRMRRALGYQLLLSPLKIESEFSLPFVFDEEFIK